MSDRFLLPELAAEVEQPNLTPWDNLAKVPGFLPRQSFSLLDADKQKTSTNPTEPTKGSAAAQETPAGESTAADAAADGQRPRKESSGLLSAPNHRLEDSDDDELEYSRSPFEDDD